jgi:hypothetical protein
MMTQSSYQEHHLGAPRGVLRDLLLLVLVLAFWLALFGLAILSSH